jgi:hypothetical protein
MDFKLVVVRPFGGHAVGSVIDDAKTITTILAGEHAGRVVRVPAGAIPSVGASGKEG